MLPPGLALTVEERQPVASIVKLYVAPSGVVICDTFRWSNCTVAPLPENVIGVTA